MDEKAEIRTKYSEEKRQKLATLEREHQTILENVYRTLAYRNELSSPRQPEAAITAAVQGLVNSAGLAAIVDTLELMGRIDRLDYTARCVDRFRKLSDMVERPR